MSDNFILKDVVEFLHNILSYLNPFDENFILKKIIQGLADILNFLNPNSDKFIGKVIVDLFRDLFNLLFVPSEERVTAITNTVQSRFSFVESIKTAVNSLNDLLKSSGNAPVITVNVGKTKYTGESIVKVIDMSWYKPFKPYGDLVVTGFAYALYIWHLFINLTGIIMGSPGTIWTTGYTVNTFDDRLSSGSNGRLSGGRKLLK